MKQNESDIELLKLAALACGYVINEARQRERELSGYSHVGLWLDNHTCWNPLADDGNALSLAVKLKISILFEFDRVIACFGDGDYEYETEYFYDKPKQTDIAAATRRAIVRAAAAVQIGRQVKTVVTA